MCSRKKHCVQYCRCNRCVTLSLGFAKDRFANYSSRYFGAIHQTISLRDITRFIG